VSLAICVLLSCVSSAQADSYAWGASIDGLEVEVTLPGFREGAGGEGWTEDRARRFARRGAELAAMVPNLRLEERLEDDEGLLAIFAGRRERTGLRDFEGSEEHWDALVRFFERLGFARRPARERALFTIAVGTSTELEPPHQAFYERCGPCWSPPAVHRVGGRDVIGVFADRESARRARRWLAARGVAGRVVPL
jgi:hypothetical protein